MASEERDKLWAELDRELEELIAQRKFCFDIGEKCTFELRQCCRTCESPDIELVDVSSPGKPNSIGMYVQSEPLYASFCNQCEQLTMTGEALHCTKCSICHFLQNTDEAIFGEE